MITREEYTREYLYEPGDMKTGLNFETKHPNGFLYGCMCCKEREREEDGRIEDLFREVDVQFGFVSEEATEYILRELRKILEGNVSVWRINRVEPKPNMITLDLVLKDENAEELPDQELIDELLERASQVTIDIHGDDIQEERGSGRLVLLYLKCQDAYDPEEISYLSIHACHNSKAKHTWKEDRVFIKIEQINDGICYHKRSMIIRWKDKKKKKMLAEIEDIY